MFSQFETERKFLANNKKSKATAAGSIQKDTPQLFFEMAEVGEMAEAGDVTEDTDPPLTTLLYMFWAAEVVWLLGIILLIVGGFKIETLISAGVFILISTVLHITNSVFLCLCRVPGRGTLSACSCDRPFCMSKPYTIASAVLILPNIIGVYIVLGFIMSSTSDEM